MATASQAAPLRGEKRWAYLTREKTIRVASTNEDGSIYLSPLWYVVDEKKIWIPIDAGSRHTVNAEAGRPVAGLVDAASPEYSTVSGVRLLGTLRATEDSDLVAKLQDLMFEKYFYVGHPYVEQYFEFGVFAGRRYLEFVTEKVIGWDSREISMPAYPEARVLPDFVQDRRYDG
jgi:uncharacterized protein YhbP (UPF0306 family)